MHILTKLGQENLLRIMRWHCPPDRGFEVRALAVWGRVLYLSVTEAPHNIESLRVSGEETFCFFETWRQEVACSASDRQGLNFEFCVWRAVSSHSSHHPQEVLQAHWRLPTGHTTLRRWINVIDVDATSQQRHVPSELLISLIYRSKTFHWLSHYLSDAK